MQLDSRSSLAFDGSLPAATFGDRARGVPPSAPNSNCRATLCLWPSPLRMTPLLLVTLGRPLLPAFGSRSPHECTAARSLASLLRMRASSRPKLTEDMDKESWSRAPRSPAQRAAHRGACSATCMVSSESGDPPVEPWLDQLLQVLGLASGAVADLPRRVCTATLLLHDLAAPSRRASGRAAEARASELGKQSAVSCMELGVSPLRDELPLRLWFGSYREPRCMTSLGVRAGVTKQRRSRSAKKASTRWPSADLGGVSQESSREPGVQPGDLRRAAPGVTSQGMRLAASGVPKESAEEHSHMACVMAGK